MTKIQALYEANKEFYDIWLTNYSHGAINKKNGKGWGTASDIPTTPAMHKLTKYIGKKGEVRVAMPLGMTDLVNNFNKTDRATGKRFASKTDYVAADIDIEGMYHPYENPEEWLRLNIALEDIGAIERILVRSSHSEGMHIYIPLPYNVSCETYSRLLHDYLTKKGFTIKAGHLELFPNKRSNRNILYNGHRLPLQPESGSYILDPQTLEPITNDLSVFVEMWKSAKKVNFVNFGADTVHTEIEEIVSSLDIEAEIAYEREYEVDYSAISQSDRIIASTSIKDIPKQAWGKEPAPGTITQDEGLMIRWNNINISGSKQTNEMMKQLTQVLYQAGLTCADAIAAHRKFGEQIPGFIQFSSDESKKDFYGGWSRRIVENWYGKCNMVTTPIRKTLDEDLNTAREKSACDRIKAAMADVTDKGITGITAIARHIFNFIKNTFGVGVGKKTLYKHLNLWHPHHHTPVYLREGGDNDPETIENKGVYKKSPPPSKPFKSVFMPSLLELGQSFVSSVAEIMGGDRTIAPKIVEYLLDDSPPIAT